MPKRFMAWTAVSSPRFHCAVTLSKSGWTTGCLPVYFPCCLAELEREYILQRQREGIEIAKRHGKYTGRQPVVHPDFDKVTAQWKRGELTAVQAMKRLGMSKATFYRRVKSVHKPA